MIDIVKASPRVRSVAYTQALPPQQISGQGTKYAISVPDGVLEAISDQSAVMLNGKRQQITEVNRSRRIVTLLGDDALLSKGLNVFTVLSKMGEAANRRFLFWNEERVLTAFEEPYPKSYAIIVAIDDYDRRDDPQHRGPTGYPQLANMRER